MRFRNFASAIVLFGAGSVLAQAPAAAPAAPAVSWYGSAQYRLREDVDMNSRKTDTVDKGAAYSNRLGYKIGAKVKANDQVSLQFELGNDWVSTEEVPGIPGNYLGKRNPLTPWFSLAYAQWDNGFCHIAAGIIPVKGSVLLDLLGSSIINNKSYKTASWNQWGVITNNSQTGLRIGAPILKKEFKLGIELMSATIEQRPVDPGFNEMTMNAPAVEFMIDVPMSYGQYVATPQAFFIPNRIYNKAADKGDMEFGLGVDLGYKLSDAMSFRAGVAVAQNSNENSWTPGARGLKNPLVAGDTTTVALTRSDRSALDMSVGTTMKLGPGKLDADLALCSEADDVDAAVKAIYPYFDLKYGYPLNKNFIVMPRVRGFFSSPEVVVKYESTMRIRPEIILTGSF
ncbi:MAG: hypothetical protein MUF22_08195 [Chitinispirillaceae bacterium]|jgi:hypothetical protein|nr:hypothetical protein [Chitinispirillaceae bacterium]